MIERIGIAVEPSPTASDIQHVKDSLVAALRGNQPPNDSQPLRAFARDAAGRLVGGLLGSTSYGWLLIGELWIDETSRGAGIGGQLVAVAEQEALSRGCHSAWLDTSSTRAERFYLRLGYRPFAELTNSPERGPADHRRVFLGKQLK